MQGGVPSSAPGISSRAAGGRTAAGLNFALCSSRRHLMAGHFLVADVLGFSNLVENLDHRDLDKRLENWINLVETTANLAHLSFIQTVSDTVFAQADDSEDGLTSLLLFSRLLLEHGIENNFPIRGAISKGNVTWGKTIYGDAVISALKLEKSQDWIGISCDADLEVPWSWVLVCTYPVPKKSGAFLLAPSVIWNVPQPEILLNKCCGEGFFKDGEILQWELFSKLKNTLEFASYVNKAKQKSLHPSKYDRLSGSSILRGI